MNILLLHEFSGVHTELQAGLRELGHNARTANFGDGFRGFPTDIKLGNLETSVSGIIRRALTQVGLIEQFRKFDVVQSITANAFNPLVSWLMEAAVLKNPEQRFVYLAASGDTVYRKHVRALPYSPELDWYERELQGANERRIFDAANQIVAGAWDYLFSFRREGYSPTFIPFPVMTRRITPRAVAQGQKLRVLHPVNRADGDDYKGTSFIRTAFDLLRKKFGTDVEFIAVGGLPYAEYMEIANTCDVLVDQANTMSYGMSAIYALAQGKVVLSGCEEIAHELEMHRVAPVINIRPDAADIATKLEALLADRARMKDIGIASRLHAEKFHDAIVVAEQYANVYRAVRAAGR
ncbi:MAG: hypothetical protein DI536_10130 [Archangium gephyra]|uniref:Glycosyltransferase n=1 Tax=Archangium gephyra TaxID=48 RepID=A0A2W5TFU2_9BACT|nr:MAG: hypothetical protein DI536_10130 [Archangium gephyra]